MLWESRVVLTSSSRAPLWLLHLLDASSVSLYLQLPLLSEFQLQKQKTKRNLTMPPLVSMVGWSLTSLTTVQPWRAVLG